MQIDFAHAQPPKPEQTPAPVTTNPLPHRHRRRWTRVVGKIFFYGMVAMMGTGVTFTTQTLLSAERAIVQKEDKTPLLRQFKYLVSADDKPLKGEANDRVNMLLFGMGGEGHSSGIYLTDTIILLSLKPSTGQAGFLSIPRDLVMEMPGTKEYRKINNLNAIGRQKKAQGGGEAFAASAIAKMLDMEIPYHVRVDFTAFRDLVDLVGGVNIRIENGFTDVSFPDYNFGYQTVSFKEGAQKMNGETALQYSRSRHGNNGEGSDFARSKRQQQILLALKTKLTSAETLANPSRISSILKSLGAHVATNLELWEMAKLARLSSKFSERGVKNVVLDSGPTSVLHSEIASETGAYVLIPDAGLGHYEEIRSLVNGMFETNIMLEENAAVEIQNGTTHPGWAAETAERLKRENFRIVGAGNAPTKDYKKSLIIDLTAGEKPETLQRLRQLFRANVTTLVPSFLESGNNGTYEDLKEDQRKQRDQQELTTKEQTDLILILGEESFSSTATSSLPQPKLK